MKRRAIIFGACAALLILGAGLWLKRPAAEPDFTFGGPTETPAREADGCIECHEKEVALWRESQHANAMHVMGPGDMDIFKNAPVVSHGPFKTQPRLARGRPGFFQTDAQGVTRSYTALGVIAVTPLIQHVVPFPGGRLQVFDCAYDTRSNTWFHVFGDDVRDARDWGYWANRSLNWNARCADCHMTHFRKNYDAESDSYASTWEHMGISCASCHGDLTAHVASPKDPALLKAAHLPQTLQQHFDVCVDCHSRREDLTGNFAPAQVYGDHFRLALLTDPGLYYADGQIRDEDFEYTSFASSRKHDKGITCFNCHNSHSGKLIAGIAYNELCMTCHVPPGLNGAVPVDLLTHGHHALGSVGNRCVECHMPETRYMVNDPRRDHAFTIPDPLLTIRHGVPNACNRCHNDKTAEWALAYCEEWYGARMDRPTRTRALAVAGASDGDPQAATALVSIAAAESNAVWKASLLQLLNELDVDAVRPLLAQGLSHASHHVRSVAVRALAPEPQAQPLLKPLRNDPRRLVRLDAAWATIGSLDRESSLYKELRHYFAYDTDQPSGAFKQAQLALAEARPADATPWLEKMTDWDSSAGSWAIKGRMLHAMGRLDEAVVAIETAAGLAPADADVLYTLALLYGELNRPEDALRQLQQVVKHDPRHGRAWYNLGLAQAQQGRLPEAIAALSAAESLMLASPDPAYAAATIHLRTQDKAAAQAAALRALKRAPHHRETQALLRHMGESGEP